MRTFILLATICVTLAAAEGPAHENQAMMQADRAFVQAVAQADKPVFERLLDADFTWTDCEGKTRSSAEVLRDLPKPAVATELKQYIYGERSDSN